MSFRRRLTGDQILDLLRLHPKGLLADEARMLLRVPKTNLSSRLSKLAAYGIIRSETVSKSVRADGKTTTATVQRYFPPLIETNQTAAIAFALIVLKTTPLTRRKYGWGGGQRCFNGQTVKLLIERGLARMEGEELVGIVA